MYYRIYKTQRVLVRFIIIQGGKMIKIRLSLLESIKDFFVGLGALLVLGFFGIMPILIVLSLWFPSLVPFTDTLAVSGLTLFLALLTLVIVFFFCVPLLALCYVPCKIIQGILSIFVEFVSDEEYEQYKRHKAKLL